MIVVLSVAVVVALVMARRAWRPASGAQVAAAAVIVVALTGTAVPVQAALWLLPLVLLAGVGWRVHLAWAGVELLNIRYRAVSKPVQLHDPYHAPSNERDQPREGNWREQRCEDRPQGNAALPPLPLPPRRKEDHH